MRVFFLPGEINTVLKHTAKAVITYHYFSDHSSQISSQKMAAVAGTTRLFVGFQPFARRAGGHGFVDGAAVFFCGGFPPAIFHDGGGGRRFRGHNGLHLLHFYVETFRLKKNTFEYAR